jgi:hypothetical protein
VGNGTRGKQLEFVLKHAPIITLGRKPLEETAMERATRIIKLWRETTFVNCWNVSEHESHAFWHIYCASVEEVAIRTTLGNPQTLIGLDLNLFGVTYADIGCVEQTPKMEDLITKKRLMFEYENEARLVRLDDFTVVKGFPGLGP